MRELVVQFNNKKLLNRYFKGSTEVLQAVENELGIEFLPIRRDVGYTYSRLRINEADDHRDPQRPHHLARHHRAHGPDVERHEVPLLPQPGP